MEKTKKELEKLLVQRKVLCMSKGDGHSEDGNSVEFTIADVKVYDHVVALLGSEREAVFIVEGKLDEFLAGEEVLYFSLIYDTYVKLLPVEEEEHVEPEPAKPRFTGKWERRWWQVYLNFFMDGKAMPIAAAEADSVVAFAQKHLEDE